MTDAVLSFKVESGQAVQAAADLDKLEASAKKAERSAIDWGQKTEVATTKVAKASTATGQFEKSLDDLVQSSGRANNSLDIGNEIVGELIAGLKGTVGPAALAGAAFTAASIAAQAAWKALTPEIKTVDAVLKTHEENIRRLGPAYEELSKKAKEYATESLALANLRFRDDANEALNTRIATSQTALENIVRAEGFLSSRFRGAKSAIDDFIASFERGEPAARAFQEEIARLRDTDQITESVAQSLRKASDAAADAERYLSGVSDTTDTVSYAFDQMQKAIDGINPKGATGKLAEVEQKASDLFAKARTGQIDIHDLNGAMDALARANLDLSPQIDEIRMLGEQAIKTQLAIDGLANTTQKTDRLGAVQPLGDFDFDQRFNGGYSKDLIDKLTPKPARGGRGGKRASDRVTEFDREIEQIRERTAALEAETHVVGLSTFAAEKYLATQQLEAMARKDAIGLTPQRVSAIDAESSAYARQVAAMEDVAKAQQDVNDRAQFFGDMGMDIFDDLTSGADGFKDALKRLGNTLADVVLQAIFLGQGPLASLFGGQPSQGNNVGGIVGQIFGLNKGAGTSSETTGSISKAVSSGVSEAFKGGSNLFASAGVTKTGIQLASVEAQGLTAKVSAEYASRFQGLFNDLDAAGYKIKSLGEGGYSYRNVAGTNNLSKHSFGEAIDINPRQNPYAVGAKGNWGAYGIDPSALAKKNGMTYGGDWNKADTMHFQVDKSASAAAKALDKMATSSTDAAKGATKAASGLDDFGSDLSSFGKNLQSFMGSAQGGGSSWFKNLSGLFGGSGGAFSFMNSISPAATADIIGAGGGFTGLFAKGGAFSGGNVIPFANGGIVDRATEFGMSGGRTGVMGEAGPEAIMPLRRGPNGSLGVAMHGGGNGGGNTTVVINQTVEDHVGVSVRNEQREREDGGIDIVTIIEGIIAKSGRKGGALNQVLERGYGAKPALKRY